MPDSIACSLVACPRCVPLASRLSLAVAARPACRLGLGGRAVRAARTSASRACSAPTPAPCSRRCRFASATPTTTRRAPPRCARCSPRACSRTCASRSTATSLVVIVEERPVIADVDFVGLKEFDKDALIKSLKDFGIGEGLPFDQALADRAEQELKRQYLTRSLYGAEVVTTVTPHGAQPRQRHLHGDRRRRRARSARSASSATRRSRETHAEGPVRARRRRLADLVHRRPTATRAPSSTPTSRRCAPTT